MLNCKFVVCSFIFYIMTTVGSSDESTKAEGYKNRTNTDPKN